MEIQALVTRLGTHPATRLGLDVGDASGRAAWWGAAIVLAGAGSEARGLAAARPLTTSRVAAGRYRARLRAGIL